MRSLLRFAAPLLAASVFAGCAGHATIREISSSKNPSHGGVPVTFSAVPGSDNTCNSFHLTHWTASDDPDVVTDVRGDAKWVYTHTFAVLPPGAESVYQVAIEPDLVNSVACGDSAGTHVDERILGGPEPAPQGGPTDQPPGGGPPNQPPPPAGPSASFTFTPSDPQVDQRVTFDGSGSSDPSGTIARYDWNFGPDVYPSQTATGKTATTTFLSGGTRTVTLTVTDDQGKTDTASQQITVTDPSSGRSVSRRAAASPAPGVYVSSSPNPQAGAVTHLFANLQQGAGAVRTYAWDFNSDGHVDASSRAAAIAHVFAHAGTARVHLRALTASGRALTTTAKIHVAKARGLRGGAVTQPFLAQIASRTAATAHGRHVLGSLSSTGGATHALPDVGSFQMQVIGGFRPGASQLLAPLLSATTRGATSIDLAHRVVHATYLLDSATTGSRTCARIVVHFPSGRGAHGTLTTLGGTASSRRLHLTAAFGVTPDLSHTRATLAGTLHATRGRARGLTKPCLALAPRKR